MVKRLIELLVFGALLLLIVKLQSRRYNVVVSGNGTHLREPVWFETWS